MTNIVIIFVLFTNASCCILLDKNKNIYATFLIIFVGEAVFMFQKIILELTNYNKFLTKKAIFMQKLIHIHRYKVDYY